MPIGFAIFITAVIVSVIVVLIYHFLIIGTDNSSGGGGGGGYNYDANIQYLNTLSASLAVPFTTSLNDQENYNNGNNFPNLPSGAVRFRDDLSKP
jgi:hypothetical protein